MCLSDYTNEELTAPDDRFDRVIGSGHGDQCMIKTRLGSKVLTMVFDRKPDGWKTIRRYCKQLPQVKN